MISLDSFGDAQPFISATLMMALLGTIAIIVMRILPLQSWRLRSWLCAAVLLQGAMLLKAPVHLGLIAQAAVPTTNAASTGGRRHLPIEPTDLGSDSPVVWQPETESRAPQTDEAVGGSRIDWRTIALLAWLGVVAGSFALALRRYVQVMCLTRRLPRAPESWQNEWNSLAGRRSSARCQLLVSETVGPLVVRKLLGYWMVVPRSYWSSLSSEQRRGVMLHELAHLERGDVWRQLIARLIAVLHWFNPLAWWALRQYEQAAECACDDRVMRDGAKSAAGFASALVQLIQWDRDQDRSNKNDIPFGRGVGFQTMAAPPVSQRISRILNRQSHGDSFMKRITIATLIATLVGFSFFQIRLTTAQEGERPDDAELQVVDEEMAQQLAGLAKKLDSSDPTTRRLQRLFGSNNGEIAILGMLNELSDQSREQAGRDALPEFVKRHFVESDNSLSLRSESREHAQQWIKKSKRLAQEIEGIGEVMQDIAANMDTATEVGGLFQRLLKNPHAPVALIIHELEGQGMMERFVLDALEDVLAERRDGTYTIVQSSRAEGEKQIKRLEAAAAIRKRLMREMPAIADEYYAKDDAHERLIKYLNDPNTATVVALMLGEDFDSPSAAANEIVSHFENASVDTAKGLVFQDNESWQQMDEVFTKADNLAASLNSIKEQMVELSKRLDRGDELTARLAEQMNGDMLPALLAADAPPMSADVGGQIRGLMSEVLSKSGGKYTVIDSHADQLAEKSRELLRVCRQIRRYKIEIDEMLERVDDQSLVRELGSAATYTMLDEMRRQAESYRPDPIALMQRHLLVQTDGGRFRVRSNEQDVVRQLIEQAERIGAEEANDDF